MSDQPVKPVFPEPHYFPEAIQETPAPPGSTPGVPGTPIYIAIPTPYPPAAAPAPEAPKAMPHVEHSYSRADFACVRCGSKNLARGYVLDYGDKFEQVHFAPKRIPLSWLNSLFNLRPWRRLLKLNAEACRDCGAVLLVVDPDELRRAEHIRE